VKLPHRGQLIDLMTALLLASLALLPSLALRGGTFQPPTSPADEGGWRGDVLEEMDALRSIFGDDISVSISKALTCRIRIDGEHGGAPVFLQVTCGRDYPDTVPQMKVTTEVDGNSAVARSLAEGLTEEAQKQRGQLMIFHLAR